MNINKNISIWRGNTTPPTSNHLWLKDGKLYHYDGTSWKENEVDLSTGENDGLMSKEDKHRLDNLVYNGLDSNDIDKALSAKQGKILSDRLEELNLSAYLIRGSVETLDDIPYDDLLSGDVYNILKPFYIDGKRYPEGTNVVWTGTKLDPLGGVVDFKDYSTTSLVRDMISSSYLKSLSHLASYTTNTFMRDRATKQTFNCKQLAIGASIDNIKLYSITIKVADDQSLLNLDKTYLYVLVGDVITVSLNSISLMSNKGKYVTWFFDGSIKLYNGIPRYLSLHTTNVISEANDNNLVNFIICGQDTDSTDVYICNDDGSLNRNTTPELAINYVDVSSIYPHMLDIKKHTISYATSELSDLTTPSHRANIKKIRINLSVMGISLINSVSIMVADDNAYDGLIHLNIYDTNSLLTVVSKNVINLSDNLGKYVTWYFTPFKLIENVNYEFFADNEQLMRIHVSRNKNEGVICVGQYNYSNEDFTPALGINIEPIVTDEIYSKVENIYADVMNNKSEINRIDNEVINFLYDVDEVKLNLGTTNAELSKTKQELTNTKQELSEIQAKIQDARAIADEGLSKADAAIAQIAEETRQRTAQDAALTEAVSQERVARTSADAELQAKITETLENTAEYLNQLKEKVDTNTTSISKINKELENKDSEIAQINTQLNDHEERLVYTESDLVKVREEYAGKISELVKSIGSTQKAFVVETNDSEGYINIDGVKKIIPANSIKAFRFNKTFSSLQMDNKGIKSFRFLVTDTSEITNMNQMFFGCSSLTSLDLSNFDTSAVGNMFNMFYNCSSLTSLDLSNFDTSLVTNMGQMFIGCSSLTSLDLSNFDTSLVTNMFYPFLGCGSLTSLLLGPNFFKTSAVTDINFSYCGKWTNETVVTSLVTNSYDRAAAGLNTLTLTLHNNTKAVLTDEQKATITSKGYTIA